MPLHGAVIAQHHLPQSFAKISQAGNVAVKGDVLHKTKREKKDEGKVREYFSKASPLVDHEKVYQQIENLKSVGC